MILDKLYCSKRQDSFTIHYHNGAILLTGDEIVIKDFNKIREFLSTIEYKPSHKLFHKIDVDEYLDGLKKAHGVDEQ